MNFDKSIDQSPDATDRSFGNPWERVNLAVLAWIRIATGVAVGVWGASYLQNDKWFHVFIEPQFLFKYSGFEWVQLWPGNAIYWQFVVTCIAAATLSVGLFTRISAATLCFSIAYVLTVEARIYVNHYYLLSCLCGLLAFLPAGRGYSIDALIHRRPMKATFWRWQLWLLRFQVGIPYVFGGIAKLNSDWLHLQPMQLLTSSRTDTPVIGDLLAQPWMPYVFSYGGIVYDLLVVPMLFWRPTRWLAVLLSLVFHLTNACLLDIGVFPWFMLAALIVFFPVDTLPKLFSSRQNDSLQSASQQSSPDGCRRTREKSSRLGYKLAACYVAIQLMLPIRPWIHPGDASWNERGHRFAWRMMLRNKRTLVHYLVVDQDTNAFIFVPSNQIMTAFQMKHAERDPELIRQGAVQLAAATRLMGVENCRIHALAIVSLNGRKPALLVDPKADLARAKPGWLQDAWVQQDPGPFLNEPWIVDPEQWWTEIRLPETFSNLQNNTPAGLLAYLQSIKPGQTSD